MKKRLLKGLFNPLVILLILMVAAAIILIYQLKNGSTFQETKSSFVEQVRDIEELATAEAFTKVVIEREDNQLFGKAIGVNLPGTKRKLLLVIPGSVKAGIDFSTFSTEDIEVDEEKQRIVLQLPPAEFLAGVDLDFERVDLFSTEGLFRSEAKIQEAFELASEAKTLVIEEAKMQGVLRTAEKNAEQLIRRLFEFEGYQVEIDFKEQED